MPLVLSTDSISEILKRHWGYEGFLPLQKEAIEAVCHGRDSLVVLPTGGGKSLCFQVPALLAPGVTVVVSPLLSLMKDQVDALLEAGIVAGRLDSTQDARESQSVWEGLKGGTIKLLYVSPERVCSAGLLRTLARIGVSSIAIDEAHCVSLWGHDFRPEYRQLSLLREALPGIPIGAYTATATNQVRQDIIEQLDLKNPEVLVGRFDRPNLLFRVQRRTKLLHQVTEVIKRHANESGIIYCISRADVEDLYLQLQRRGFRALPYHAKMSDDQRKRNQDAFQNDEADIIVATVAFGMGIDKSNVRYVIHAGMPKSIEHYQQETGRAGRDGLEAECCLFFSGKDYHTWKLIISNNATDSLKIQLGKLSHMYRFCEDFTCRHRALSAYFGQSVAHRNCMACDVCLADMVPVHEPLIIGQKILSSVVRQQERFGVQYTAAVLTGSKEDRILTNSHHQLSTYGLLSDHSQEVVKDWIEQLLAQGFLERAGDYGILKVTPKGRQLLRSEQQPRLLQSAQRPLAYSAAREVSWMDVDHQLFEKLRRLRLSIAHQRGVPAYVILTDATLRELARHRPASLPALTGITGIGKKKIQAYGDALVEEIRTHLRLTSR
jgi:ATP-dependent DNA helicase RecQ